MMITIFNRRELLVTGETSVLNRAEAILKENRIAYRIIIDENTLALSAGAGRTRGTPLPHRQTVYRIYVKKDAYEHASYLIRNA